MYINEGWKDGILHFCFPTFKCLLKDITKQKCLLKHSVNHTLTTN